MQCAAQNEDSAPEALGLKFTPLGTGYLLAEVTRLLRASVDRRMLDLGLTGSMWRVLVYLQREDGRSQADLAKELEVSRASLGQMRWRRKFGQLAKVGSTSMKDGLYDWEAEAVHG